MHRSSRLTALLLIFACLPAAEAPAQTRGDGLHELHRQTWTTRDGIPHNTINAIAQTPDGYLWLATWEGIARYNGHRFRIFERGPTTGLPDAGVLSLSLTPEGRLLAAGARGSITLTDGRRWTPFDPAGTMISHAVIDAEEQLWLATQGSGVIRRKASPEGQHSGAWLPEGSAQQILTTPGVTWAATSRGLLRVADGTSTLLGPESGLPRAPALSLLEGDGGRLLVGTEQGLYVGDLEQADFRPLHPGLTDQAISALLRDDADQLWVGTINEGLFRLRDDRLEHLGTEGGLPNNRILAIHQDFEQSIWVGTNGGLLRLRSAPFITLTREQGLAGNYVRALLPHSDGSLWVGTSEGVSRILDNDVQPVLDDGRPIRLSVLSLAETAAGDVLIGTHADGVLHWRNGRIVERHNRSTGLPSNDIRFIHDDSRGRSWFATASGLALLEEGEMEVFQPEDGLPGDFVIAVHEDRRGHIWIGTGFGLAHFEGERFEPISLQHLDEAMYVYGIHDDLQEDWLWLATDRGLVRFHPDSREAELIGRSAGIPVDKLFQVVDDRQGGLWLTSNRGIIRIQREAAIDVAEGRSETIQFELYTEGDGMLSAQANGGAGPAAVWHGGQVRIATAAGLASVDPDHLTRYEDTTLPVSIEQLEADGEPIELSERITLPPGTSRIAIRYAGLGFIMPQRIRYRTRLEGFDDSWVSRGDQGIAEYTNLGPGEYVFRVSAAYPYGDWNGSEARIHFVIQPLPWERAWFWVMVVLVLVGLATALTRWRMHRLERRAVELRHQVDQKTRELKQQAEAFERQARIDQLTGLANRRAFDEWLAAEFARSRRAGQALALVVMDLDHFKMVNDNYSHLIGDQVMKLVADQLRGHIRTGDQAARWGGEEFTLTFRDTTAEGAAQITERIRASLESTDFGEVARDLTMTASFGISDSTRAEHYEELLRQADQALYRAKSEGRNRVIVWSAGNDA